jgi:hypothetical protein
MPLVFFVAGASNALGRKKTLPVFYATRIQRILIPYWIFALVSMFIAFLTGFDKFTFNFVLQWIIPLDKQESNLLYLTSALWFIPIYLIVMMLFPLMKWYFEKFEHPTEKRTPLVIFALIILILSSIPAQEKGIIYYVRTIAFYSFWTYIGLFYNQLSEKKRWQEKKGAMVLMVICMVITGLLAFRFRHYANMQWNKFPPNHVYLLYTVGALSAIYLFSEYIMRFVRYVVKNGVINWIFEQYKHNGYTIYLFHPFAFLILREILIFTGLLEWVYNYEWIYLPLYLLFIIPVSAVFGRLLSWTEKIKIIK